MGRLPQQQIQSQLLPLFIAIAIVRQVCFLANNNGWDCLRIETQHRPSWLIEVDLSKQPTRHVSYINSTEQWDFLFSNCNMNRLRQVSANHPQSTMSTIQFCALVPNTYTSSECPTNISGPATMLIITCEVIIIYIIRLQYFPGEDNSKASLQCPVAFVQSVVSQN